MAGLTYYTLAYVGIQDNSLRVAWTVGLIAVVFWTCVAVFFERGYLQQDPVTTGVARLKVRYFLFVALLS